MIFCTRKLSKGVTFHLKVQRGMEENLALSLQGAFRKLLNSEITYVPI